MVSHQQPFCHHRKCTTRKQNPSTQFAGLGSLLLKAGHVIRGIWDWDGLGTGQDAGRLMGIHGAVCPQHPSVDVIDYADTWLMRMTG